MKNSFCAVPHFRRWSRIVAAFVWFVSVSISLAQNSGGAKSNISREAAATVVIFNNLDAVSTDLAGYYAEKRGIPFDHLIGLDCSSEEEISRAEYDRTIAAPLRKIFSERGWWKMSPNPNQPVVANKMRFVALMRGIPLKITGTTNYPGNHYEGQPEINRNEAAVDSELSVLGLCSPLISGVVKNPYYHSFTAFQDEAALFPLMLVCRLDGPTGKLVKQIIDESLATERDGLWGFAYIDSRGITDGGLAEGDKWLNSIAKDAREHGIPVIQDNADAQFHADYPMRNAALYFGWYSQEVSGPIARQDFRFARGAVAVHIHSNSGATVRNPGSVWVAPLLMRGAAATLGNVYEPYLALTPNLDIFEDRLRNGFTFAESAYMSMRALSWMTTFVGDPLYRPFKVVQDSAEAAPKFATEWIAYREGAKLWFTQNRAAGEKALLASARQLRSGVIYEGLGLLQWNEANDTPSAIASFEQAERCYANAEDAVRTIIHRVQILRAAGKPKDALALARRGIKAFPNAVAINVLRSMETELAPPPSPTSSPSRKPDLPPPR